MPGGNDTPEAGSPGERIAAEMVKQLALNNVQLERVQPLLVESVEGVEELCSYFECFSRTMGVLADMKRNNKTKRLSLDDFVHAWEIAEEETWPPDDGAGEGGGGDDGGDPRVPDREPVGAGDRRA